MDKLSRPRGGRLVSALEARCGDPLCEDVFLPLLGFESEICQRDKQWNSFFFKCSFQLSERKGMALFTGRCAV